MKLTHAVYLAAGLGIWLGLYVGLELAIDLLRCPTKLSLTCGRLHQMKELLALVDPACSWSACPAYDSWRCAQLPPLRDLLIALVPAYLVGRRLGRDGLAYGGAASFAGWLAIRLAEVGTGGPGLHFDLLAVFCAWHLLAGPILIGALAGGVGQLHHRSPWSAEKSVSGPQKAD